MGHYACRKSIGMGGSVPVEGEFKEQRIGANRQTVHREPLFDQRH